MCRSQHFISLPPSQSFYFFLINILRFFQPSRELSVILDSHFHHLPAPPRTPLQLTSPADFTSSMYLYQSTSPASYISYVYLELIYFTPPPLLLH